MNSPIMDINAFSAYCGQFEADTIVNNTYGCNHPENEEWEYVKANNLQKRADDEKVKIALLRKRFGNYHTIIQSPKEAVEWMRLNWDNDELLAEINVKKQGKCYAHSCPLACRMEREDWEEIGEDPDSFSDDWVSPLIDIPE